jgi:uncharacterized protein YutD
MNNEVNKIMIHMNGYSYEIVKDYRSGWNEEEFQKRYTDILNKYDFIVGDWGYNQLRLRGFYENQNRNANYDNKVSAIEEYILEYCNFGCPYFVIKKVAKIEKQSQEEEKAQP